MYPYETDVSSKYGAPMGRGRSDTVLAGKVNLRRVPAADGGDYDPGGAYWGDVAGRYGCQPLWCAWGEDGDTYVRANDRNDAKAKIVAKHPNARFYR